MRAWWQAPAGLNRPLLLRNPKFSKHSFGCHFVEVTWQPEIARLRVSRVVIGDRRRPNLESSCRPQPDPGGSGNGHRNGAVRRNHLRSAERCAHQQQSGGLHDDGERRRASDRRALPRLSLTKKSMNWVRAGSARSVWPESAAAITDAVPPCDRCSCARTASED